jgi:hypothetical protein
MMLLADIIREKWRREPHKLAALQWFYDAVNDGPITIAAVFGVIRAIVEKDFNTPFLDVLVKAKETFDEEETVVQPPKVN